MIRDQQTRLEIGYAFIFFPRMLRVEAAQRTLAGGGIIVCWAAEHPPSG